MTCGCASHRESGISPGGFPLPAGKQFVLPHTPGAAGPGRQCGGRPEAQVAMLELVENAPDGFVVTDLAGRILTANRAFIDLAQIATEDLVRGNRSSVGSAGPAST